MTFSAHYLIASSTVAGLEGSLVAIPRARAMEPLSRVRSHAWAAVLPGSILVGTFVPLCWPSFASGVVVLAALGTPLLALAAAACVAARRRALLVASAIALLCGALLGSGQIGALSSSALTALGCLAIGVALTRLIPARSLVAGVFVMAIVDVLLLAMGTGQPAAALISNATTSFHGPVFDSATIGAVRVDYPDLVLAGVLGGFVAGQPGQLRAAAALTLLSAASGMFLPVVPIVPETVPIALTFALVCLTQPSLRRRAPSRSRPRAGRRPRVAPRPAQIGAALERSAAESLPA